MFVLRKCSYRNLFNSTIKYYQQKDRQFLKEKNVEVCFSGVSSENQRLLRGVDLIPNVVPEECVFKNIEECVMWLNEPGQMRNQNRQELED